MLLNLKPFLHHRHARAFAVCAAHTHSSFTNFFVFVTFGSEKGEMKDGGERE